jgi:VanZ family protein
MVKKNIFSILVALVILYLSLANAQTFAKVPYFNIPDFDKIVHFGMYFSLMSVIIFENRKSIKSSRQLFLIALIPFLFGVSMEILQSTLTITRTGSIYDAIANLAGVITSLLLWLWIKPFIKQEIK